MRTVNRGGRRRVVDPLAEFLREETASGAVLLAAALVALVWANSPLGESYFSLWERDVAIGVGGATLDLSLHAWVNDALMAVFFFVAGMEIKRELVAGDLRDRRAAALPALAAVGGVVTPALLFWLLTAGGEAAHGWAIPSATDIAFAVGALALLGDRVHPGVRLFLLTIAVVDDVIAIAVIAVFYAGSIEPLWLAVAAAALAAVAVLRRLGVGVVSAYLPLALLTWLAVHASGVHATIAGVALGLLVPVGTVGGRDLRGRLERWLVPVSAFAIVPLFALANAGVDLGGGVLGEALGSRLTWAVAIGLVVGKLLGISGATLLALRLRVGVLPEGMRRADLPGVAALGGIGFTVSLFVAELAYDDPALTATAKVGIFAGSIAAGLLGTALLLARR
jgi:NhaA family Na+:H+ antiporter